MLNITALYPSCKPTKPDDSEIRGLPPGFSVSAYPILARHWFGFGAPPFVLDETGEAESVKNRPNHHGGEARNAELRQAG